MSFGQWRCDRRIMQQAQGGDRLIEPGLEVIRLETEVEREATMQIATQPPDPVEIFEHCVAKAWRIWPQIGGPEGRTGKQFWIVGREFEPDVEGLLDVGGFAGIECLTAEPDVAAVAPGTGERGSLPDRSRSGEEGGGVFENASSQRRRDSMSDNVEETDV